MPRLLAFLLILAFYAGTCEQFNVLKKGLATNSTTAPTADQPASNELTSEEIDQPSSNSSTSIKADEHASNASTSVSDTSATLTPTEKTPSVTTPSTDEGSVLCFYGPVILVTGVLTFL